MRLVSALKLGQVSLGNVEWLIIDEADRLFDNGYERQVQTIRCVCLRIFLILFLSL